MEDTVGEENSRILRILHTVQRAYLNALTKILISSYFYFSKRLLFWLCDK